MKYLSLFTGAGGIDLGLDAAGWSPVGQCEIDPTCRAVLARHWPDVPRWDDVRDVAHPDVDGGRRPVGASDGDPGPDCAGSDPRLARGSVDLIAGGFPCQDVSVAGRRAGLAGDRSGLWWEFHRVIDAVRPGAVLVENVEGLLSSNGGRDMGAIVDALVDLGYGVAWRVLDAQHLGVPQRRRRVFLLAITGGRTGTERAAQVFALTQGSNRDLETRRSERPRVAATLTSGSHRTGVNAPGRRKEDDYNLVVGALAGRSASRLDDACAGGGQLVPTTVGSLMVPAGGCRIGADEAAGGQLVPLALHLIQTPITGLDVHTTGVRRLTPRECERLMGWPDDHTRWTHDGREVADSRRYAMCGNGVVAPVAAWIGGRLHAESRAAR